MPFMGDQADRPALWLEGLTVSAASWFGRRRRDILRGIDLRLDAGRRLGLIGPNGSGKSTLLRAIAGLERTKGRLEVLGASPSEPRVRARLGFLGEDTRFPEELTAHAALHLIGSIAGLPRSERRRRVPEVLEQVGLAAVARRRLGRYSRGMRRRFGLAQAVLHEPELLLLDEPTAGLDAEGYEALEEILGAARERGVACVLCSHAPDDFARWCDEVAVLHEGRIAKRGAREDVLPSGGPAELYAELRRSARS